MLAGPASGQQKIMTEEEFVQQGEQWGKEDGMAADPRCPDVMEVLKRCVVEDDAKQGMALMCLQQVGSTALFPSRARDCPARRPPLDPTGPRRLGAVGRRGAGADVFCCN